MLRVIEFKILQTKEKYVGTFRIYFIVTKFENLMESKAIIIILNLIRFY